MDSSRRLLIDIETSPNVADVWALWNQNIGLPQLRESTRMICFAAKWAKEPKRNTQFYSEWKHGHDDMVGAAWSLLDQADVIEHFNGERFDTPHLNREFLLSEMGPPAPYQQIDLLKVVRARFKFPSNKLQYVSSALGYEGKLAHEGHSLWTKVLAGDVKSQKLMQKYNERDVIALEELHDRLLPWIPGIPSQSVYGNDPEACPFCGSAHFQRRGWAYTSVSRYPRYHCQDCGGWYRGVRRELGSKVRAVAA